MPAAEPASVVEVRNRQRDRPLDSRRVRTLARAVLADLGCSGEVAFHFIPDHQMAQLNWHYLHHEGSTDILTFDHGSRPGHLHGECFISVAEAVRQAAEFGTDWEREVVRYVVHGLLHLAGYDDLEPEARKRMKRVENRLTRRFAPRFPLAKGPGQPRQGARGRQSRITTPRSAGAAGRTPPGQRGTRPAGNPARAPG
ncbi:MAG: rRNA maturation RNase YbeY [Verrucomicrobiota bacterium]